MFRTFIRAISTTVTGHRRQGSARVFHEKHALPTNPGIRHRLKAMEEDGDDVAIGPDMDLYENMESDFSAVHKSHRQHEEEATRSRELLKRRIISQKYFDEQSPNFLTWSEKEHIRHLHQTDPREWTPERLAQSFPINEDGVRKIIKVVWKPASQSRIDRHDGSALRNWKELKNGTIEDMTPELKAHVLKFTKRVIPPRSEAATRQSQLIEMKIKAPVGEFGSIVIREQKPINNASVKQIEAADDIKYVADDAVRDVESSDYKSRSNSLTVRNNKSLNKNTSQLNTLEGLRKNIIEKSENLESLSLVDKLIVSPMHEAEQVESKKVEESEPVNSSIQIKSNVTAVSNFQSEPETLPSRIFAEKIKIPDKAWKKGGTYKVEDCYYDDDGLFLYRVPGMVNSVK